MDENSRESGRKLPQFGDGGPPFATAWLNEFAVAILNDDTQPWTNALITIDADRAMFGGSYTHHAGTVPPGETITIPLKEFAHAYSGERWNVSEKKVAYVTLIAEMAGREWFWIGIARE